MENFGNLPKDYTIVSGIVGIQNLGNLSGAHALYFQGAAWQGKQCTLWTSRFGGGRSPLFLCLAPPSTLLTLNYSLM